MSRTRLSISSRPTTSPGRCSWWTADACFAEAALTARPPDRLAALHDVVIIGGGCYGGFYAGQLVEGRSRGLVAFERLLVVDRDPGCQVAREKSGIAGLEVVVAEWGTFLDGYLADRVA